jgi:hypothetical protein
MYMYECMHIKTYTDTSNSNSSSISKLNTYIYLTDPPNEDLSKISNLSSEYFSLPSMLKVISQQASYIFYICIDKCNLHTSTYI